MAYQDFLEEFSVVQGIGDVTTLLEQHAQQYQFQINSRKRAQDLIKALIDKVSIDPKGMKILDVGCAYGSFTIELAKMGADIVGIDISDKWLKLAEINAKNEVDAIFLNCDASSRKARHVLEPYGPFDLVIVNDVFEHIYDTTGLLDNIYKLLKVDGLLYYKIPNGHATRHVLSEGHKKVFGIAQLPPDYWHLYVKAPFHIYYRRWEYFEALFSHFKFKQKKLLNENHDANLKRTRQHILSDCQKMRDHLKIENFENFTQFAHVRRACDYYFEELETDVKEMDWEELFRKYRVTFWEGILQK